MIKVLGFIGFIALSSQAACAQNAKWEQSPKTFLANSGPRGTFSYSKTNDEMVRLPLLWVDAAIIAEPVSFHFGDKVESLPAGTTLPAVVLTQGAGTTGSRVAYCTPSRIKQKVKGSLLGGNLVGALLNKIENSFKDSQKCLEDADGDGKFDRTFMVGEGPNDLTPGGQIAPIPYTRQSLAPIGAGDYLVLELWNVGKKNIRVGMTIYEGGDSTFFDAITDGQYFGQKVTNIKSDRDYGNLLQIYGIRFIVKSADPVTKVAEIEWPEDAPKTTRPIVPIELRAARY